jgi:hypothetical protein
VPEPDDELKRDLECLRLASDFMQMSRDALNRDLEAHCVQMAKYWCDQAARGPSEDIVLPRDGSGS